MTEPSIVSASISIDAPPAEVWAAVATINALARYSPETTATEWLPGFTQPHVGARFRGDNRNGRAEWSTECTIIEYDELTAFAFDVAQSPDGSYATRWRYELQADQDGTLLTETFQSPFLDAPSAEMNPQRKAVLAQMLEATLRAIKTDIETEQNPIANPSPA